ncbi:MAG: GTPase ObgE [Clostridia bacterium]|nr:GTPase ObgE [Clostridia bacterium]
MFVDKANITVKAGNGGNGLVSFHREKYVPDGGPDGGDGGKGGNIVFKADKTLSTLIDFAHKKVFTARNGEDGKARRSSGRKGEDLYIYVPVGTVIREAKTSRVMKDMSCDGEEFIAAQGGNGGWGNVHFASATRQTPKFAKDGLKGQERELTLELKLLADVGLAGFPNVGKSTLLSAVSAARPKIANYHFTTLEPNLGVVKMGEGKSFVMADIPGLIEGAHEGIGLGHEFLRHIERTRLIVHIVDVSGIEGRNPIEDFEKINEELSLYSESLGSRPQIVAANKIDIITDSEAYEDFKKYIADKGIKLFEISAATHSGTKELINYVSMVLDTLEPVQIYEADFVEEDFEEEPFQVRKEDDTYVVEGPYVEKLLRHCNFEDAESMQYFQLALRRKGIIEALENAGCSEGDPVRMYELEFDYTE